MFEAISEKLSSLLSALRNKGKVRAEDLTEVVRQLKVALLEADVNFKVVQQLTNQVTTKLVGSETLPTLGIDRHFTAILQQELETLLGEAPQLDFSRTLMVGLQGSGKTTTTAKLAHWLRQQGHTSLLVPADVARPAAILQLKRLGEQYNLPVFDPPAGATPSTIVRQAMKTNHVGPLIVDTAGRLQVDTQLMEELKQINDIFKPTATLLVLDAMTGQQAINVAKEFNLSAPLSGLVLTKMDSDTRGGAALSIKQVTGVPIAFFGLGESAQTLEPFDAKRLVGRLLGMGDLTGLLERLQGPVNTIDNEPPPDIEALENPGDFTLEVFLKQLKWIRRLGPLQSVFGMLPGFGKASKGLDFSEAEASVKRIGAMIHSMTVSERRDPRILNARRRLRIAKGSGTKVEELNRFMKQYEEMKKLIKRMGRDGLKGLTGRLAGR